MAKSLPKYPNIDNLAKQNLSVIGEVYKMNNSYQQLTTNLEYLKLKQMAQHLGEVVDFSINKQQILDFIFYVS